MNSVLVVLPIFLLIGMGWVLSEYSAQGIAITTLVSMLSLPLWIKILGIAA
jgi:predicted permease